jgi:vacuolar-type H+-ATPase subunit E/Vma4
MTGPNQNLSDAFCGEILADARREAGQILQHARQQAAEVSAQAETEAGQLREQRLAEARAEAGRRRDLLLLTVPIEAGRLRSAHLETLLQSVYEDARRRLLARDGFDCAETLIALAAGAVSQMAGESFVVSLSPADHAAYSGTLAGAVVGRSGRPSLSITLASDPSITEGGVVVQDAEGRQCWDNRLTVRLDRLWPELRRQIARQTSLVRTDGPTGGGT